MNKLISILVAAAVSASLEGISGCGLLDRDADKGAWKTISAR